MSTQMLICLCIFAFMLVSFLLAKIPLGVTASCVAILLTVTKCVEAAVFWAVSVMPIPSSSQV